MSRELLKRALDLIGNSSNVFYEKLAKDIETYLSQPEPEPVAYEYTSTCGNRFVKHTPPQYARNIRPLYTTPPDQSARIVELKAALQLAKDMMIANDLSLPRTFEVIDEALAKAKGEV